MLLALLFSAASPDFDAIRVFLGHTHGEGRMKVILRPHDTITVEGDGRLETNGTLVLDQTVTQSRHPPRHRQWRLRETSPGHYEGTLSDARGAVLAESNGDRIQIRFKSRDGFDIAQSITLDADRRRATNRLVARRLGIVVATLDETIVKSD